MRRAYRNPLAVIAIAVLLALGMAWARPGWLPSWADIGALRHAAWAHLGGSAAAKAHASDDDEEKKPRNENEAEPIVRLASPKLVRRLGFEFAAATRERHVHRLTCNAETAFNGQHMAEVVSRVSGVVREVRVDLGQVVRKGDVLAVVEAAQVGSSKVQYHTTREAAGLARPPTTGPSG